MRLGRQVAILIGMSCLLLAAYSAPLSDESLDGEQSSSAGLAAAIDAVRAKRDTRKMIRSKPVRSLVRYRYPIHTKRSGPSLNDEEEDEVFLPGDDDLNGRDVDLTRLAKDIALGVMSEQLQKSDNDDLKKKKKRMQNLIDQLTTDGDDDHSAEDEDDEVDERMLYRAMIKALAEDGVSQAEIEALLAHMDTEDEDDSSPEIRKRSQFEWDLKKMPRASWNRWRYLHTSSDGHRRDSQDSPDNFYGRGFHRLYYGIPGSLDEERPTTAAAPISTPDAPAAAPSTSKRIQYPWKTMNVINKRSASHFDDDEDSGPVSMSRRKRSLDSNEASLPLNKTAPNSTAEKVINHTSSLQHHSGIIRKKSVDWDDYFGIDKRSSDDNELKDYLENEYYKSIAGSLASRRKRGGHAGHGMKRNNRLESEKKRSSIKSRDNSALSDVEEALDAAFQAAQESRDPDTIDRVGAQLVAQLVDELSEEDLNRVTGQLAQELVKAIEEEESSLLQDRLRDLGASEDGYPQGSQHNLKRLMQNKSSHKEDRRKRNKKQARGEEDCPIAEQVLATCDTLAHLMGGYRPILGDACIRHQVCSICTNNEETLCDVDFQHHVVALCGPDLLCRSQSRHLLSALGEIDRIEDELFQGNAAQIHSLCRRDSCLADFWKRR